MFAFYALEPKNIGGMQPKSESSNQLQAGPNVIQPYTINSKLWWCSGRNNVIATAAAGGNASNVSSLDGTNDSESNDDQSLLNSRLNEEDDDATKESRATTSSRSVGNSGQEHQSLQHVTSSMSSMHDELLMQTPQFELVSHSIACASNPYQEQYYGAMMTAYGNEPLGCPQFAGMLHARKLLPLEMAQEPVYVNAKQYQGILRRRQARAKAEVEKKLIKVRKPYLHESRHRHAMRRARGTGGRFAKKTEAEPSKQTAEGKINSSGAAPSSQSGSSSGSEPLPSDSVGTWNSSNSQVRDSSEAQNYGKEDGHYQNHGGLQTSTYSSCMGDKGEDGDCLGQQRGRLASNQGSQRPLLIQ